MHLHEEYINRHKLDIPLVRYDSYTTVFLESCRPTAFWILDIQWHSCHWHPGNFKIVLRKPLLDSPERFENHFPREVYWDEYEEYLLGLCQDLKGEFVAITKDESQWAAWHMFLLAYDSHLARLGSPTVEKIADSICPENTPGERSRLLLEAMVAVKRKSPPLFERLEEYLRIEQYADWLVELING